jgi:hypothetical protein
MEQGYYSKDHAGYYREGFLAHGSMFSSRSLFIALHMSGFDPKRT